MRVETQILQCLLRARDKAAQRAERFGERSVDKRDTIFHAEVLGCSSTIFAAAQYGVRFVNENAGVMRLRDSNQFRQISEVAVHGVNTLDNHELAPRFLTAQRGIKRCRIIMLELLSPASRQHGTVAKTKMRTVVQKGHVALAKQSRDRAKRTAESAVENHGVLASKKFRDAPFEFAMQISHSREHRGTARPHSVGP